MILTCPSCGTQYVVKDGAIPPEGRQVRCAACKHSWHQDPETEQAPEVQPEAAADTAAAPEEAAGAPASDSEERVQTDESLAQATLIEPRSGPDAEQRAYEEAAMEGDVPAVDADAVPEVASAEPAVESEGPAPTEPASTAAAADWDEPPVAEAAPDMFSPFAEDGAVERRGRSPLLGLLIFIAIVIVAAALFWFLAPATLKAKLGVTAAAATPLQLVTTHMDRTPLESGNELLTVTGRVINPSAKEQDVPPIQAQLKNRSGAIVYSWTIQPPAHSLAAGASAAFNSAEVNVPPGADELTITLGEPKA